MPTSKGGPSFFEVLSAALSDLANNGYQSSQQVEEWRRKLEEAARRSMTPLAQMDLMLRQYYESIFRSQVEKAAILKLHPGVGRFTVQRLQPQLRDILTKRLAANRDLIVLNRDREIAAMAQRFSGWATSIPEGGIGSPDKQEAKENIRKSLAGLSFRERRVMIDQGHKFISSLSEVIATNTGAIAAIWHSRWREVNYDYREDHKERDEIVYVLRGNWAMEKGLMKLAGHDYTDAITQPGEEPYCRCSYRWVYNIRDLPRTMLTAKGEAALKQAA